MADTMSALAPLEMTAWIAGSVMPGSPCCRWSRCRSRRVCRGGQRPGRQRMRGQPHGHRPGGDQHVQRPGEKTAPGPPPRYELGSLMTAAMNPRRSRWPRRAPRRGPSLRGAHLLLQARTHVLKRPARRATSATGTRLHQVPDPAASRRSLRHFVPLSYDCRVTCPGRSWRCIKDAAARL
jgi:hypothetical protein